MGKVSLKKIFVNIPAAGTKVQVTSSKIFVSRFELFVPDGNTGSVYIGGSDVGNAGGADGGHIPRAKASSADNANGIHVFIASENSSLAHGDQFDLSEMYLAADNANDKAIIMYVGA